MELLGISTNKGFTVYLGRPPYSKLKGVLAMFQQIHHFYDQAGQRSRAIHKLSWVKDMAGAILEELPVVGYKPANGLKWLVNDYRSFDLFFCKDKGSIYRFLMETPKLEQVSMPSLVPTCGDSDIDFISGLVVGNNFVAALELVERLPFQDIQRLVWRANARQAENNLTPEQKQQRIGRKQMEDLGVMDKLKASKQFDYLNALEKLGRGNKTKKQ